jgi:calcineurin-like phosphoesterase family protein/2'-5' RNA ligase
MAHFLVEFRLHGYAREYAKWARARTLREARRLGVRRLQEPRFVPHITLFGAADTHNLRNVVREVEKVGRKYTLVPFRLGVKRGEFQVEDANWLYLDIQPSPELEQFQYDLAQGLLGRERVIYDTCPPYDRKPKYEFHCSIGKYDPRDTAKFENLAEYAETKCSLEAFKQRQISLLGKLVNIIEKNIFKTEKKTSGISQHLLRVTVLGRGNRIQGEYDLILKKLLPRREALSSYWWRKTIEGLRIELSPLREEWLSVADASACYLIGDTHFNHKSTITKFIHRPFSNVTEMNKVMSGNWNKRVGENDRVYFLGDYTGPPPRNWGKYYKQLRYWTKQLEGSKVSILGNHDRIGGCIEFERARVLHVERYNFLLIHNPSDEKAKAIKARYDWVIHGHVHNNEMDRYPFINGEQKTINVSAELINYEPVSLGYLLSLGLDSIKRMRTIDSQPERW